MMLESRFMVRCFWIILVAALALGCSVKKMAVNSMADAMARSSAVYATDEDPELVKQALPFGLKTIESLLSEAPKNRQLLISAASGFTQYAYGFVWLDAEALESTAPEQAKLMRNRAQRLYLRARDYGLRALEVDHPHFREVLNSDSNQALKEMSRSDVPALYWTAASWAASVTQAKGDMDLVADLPVIEAMMRRALNLDEPFEQGSIHEFFLAYEAGHAGGSLEKARQHFEAAMRINGGRKMAPLVALAEDVSAQAQNRKEFLELLDRALTFDVNSAPELRLSNLLAQKRAAQLKARIDDLFLGDEEEGKP